ncbi:uncharacterized protein LOC126781461 [Nymphalis io]|uniref:uncharacterized protein LOC126781461 n=1 Tax=Inachis io TaxID=171585 RepID=UPI0021675E9D|nr:uncharacterized protein LOC126781461 [Nymphalis io]
MIDSLPKAHLSHWQLHDQVIIRVKMRLATVISLALTIALAISMRCCEGTRLRGLSLTEEEDDIQPRRFYREYGLIRNRPVRADDSFDDYGHLRFGRSED